MASQVRIYKDIALFLNTISFVGMLKEFDHPTVEQTTAPHETLAMAGSINVGVGFEAMEARLAWEGHSKDLAKLAYNTVDQVELMVRSIIEDRSGPVLIEQGVVHHMRGVFRSNQPGNFSAKSLATKESMMDLTYFREEIDGEVMIELDVVNNIYKVAGVDKFANRNRILGLT